MRFDALIVSHIFGILPGGLMESQAGLYQERCTIIFLCNQEISISVHLIAYVFFVLLLWREGKYLHSNNYKIMLIFHY